MVTNRHPSHVIPAANQLLRINDVTALTGLSKSYIHALAAAGRFPKSLSLVPGGTSRAWVYSEVQEWIDQRIAARAMEAAND